MKNIIDERVLSIKIILVLLLKKWKVVLLCLLLGSLILGTYKYLQDVSIINDLKESNQEIKELLTEQEVNETEKAVQYYDEVKNGQYYLENSVIMSYDPAAVPYVSLLYCVNLERSEYESDEKYVADVQNIIYMYTSYVQNGKLAQDIQNEGCDLQQEYISELLFVSDDLKEDRNYFIVGMYMEEGCLDFKRVVEDAFSAYNSQIASKVAAHDIKFVEIYSGIKADDNIYNKKINHLNNMYTLENRLGIMLDDFTEYQQTYYNVLIGNENIINDDEWETQSVTINVKYVLLGGIIGIILASCVIVFMAMVSSVIVSEYDYTTMFGLKYYGMILGEKEYTNSLNENASLCQKWEYGDTLLKSYDDNIAYIALKIKLSCDLVGNNKIALVSSDLSAISVKIIESLKKRLLNEGVEMVCIDNITTDGTNLEALFDIGNCMFIEKTNQSRITQIREIVDLCNENNINVLGVVDLKQ